MPKGGEWLPDTELQRVLEIAAHVGYESGDQVNVSYTSLLIGRSCKRQWKTWRKRSKR